MPSNLYDIINFHDYPITDLESRHCDKILRDCHNQLEDKGLCLLPNFVQDNFINEMLAEVKILQKKAFYTEHWRSPYGEVCTREQNFSNTTRASTSSIAFDLLGDNSKLRTLYESDFFTEFLRKVLKTKTFFKCADRMISCIITICRESDELGWHYDPNDGVVSLLLQKSLKGGNFEFAPNVRMKNDKMSEREMSILNNENDDVITPIQNPGTLSIFNGTNSLHRVSQVKSKVERIMILLSYSNKQNYIFAPQTRKRFFGRSN